MVKTISQFTVLNGISGGPFKATELWNSIVRYVRDNVEVGRRRARIKHHDQCFSATEVVDVALEWLETQRGNFTKDITREKAVKVLVR